MIDSFRAAFSGKKWKNSFFGVLFNASWMTGAKFAGELANFVLFIILSRRYGPAGIGQYAYALAIALLAYTFVDLDIGQYGIRECARLSVQERQKFLERILGLQLQVLVPVILVLVGFLLVSKNSMEIIYIVGIISTHYFLLNFGRTCFIPAYSQQSMAGPATAEFLCRVGGISVAILLSVQFHTSLPITLLPLPVFSLLLLAFAVRSVIHHNEKLQISVNIKASFMVLKEAWPFAASGIVSVAYARLGLIIVTVMLGDAAAGYYATGLKFLDAGVYPFYLLGIAVYPVLSQYYVQDEKNFLNSAGKLLRAELIAGGLLVWVLFFIVPSVLAPLLGDKFVSAAPIVKGMAILGLLFALECASVRIMLAMNLQVKRVKVQFLATILNVILAIILIPFIGIFGAVVATIISQTFLTIVYFTILGKDTITRPLLKTVGSFLTLFSLVIVSVVITWHTPYEWLPAVISLVMFCGTMIGTGFFPLMKLVRYKDIAES